MPSRPIFIVMAVLIMFATACSSGDAPPQDVPTPNETLKNDISIVETDAGTFMGISREAMGKEFLLQGSLAVQKGFGYGAVSNPTSSGMRSRIVRFEEDGNQVLMLESGGDFKPGEEMPSNILVAAFPVKSGDDARLVFDFNKGMDDAVLSWDWYVSDFYGKVIQPDASLAIDASFIRKTGNYEDAISVVQTLSAKMGRYSIPIEITYYLAPYRENKDFKPVVSPGFRYLGYFEANPLVQEGFGAIYTNASKWDITRPVIYYVSSSVPMEYRQAVKEGILYWNRAFGRDVIRAEDAPEGLSAPDFEHNIVQWHTEARPWAYADAQVDPRTGEILHAQIFLSGGVASWSRFYSIPRIDREIEGEAESDDGETPTANGDGGVFVGVRDMTSPISNMTDFSDAFTELYSHRDVINALPQERLSALTNDAIREIVAHEVGHTLGLRHNFAATAYDGRTAGGAEAILKNYFKTGALNEKEPPIANSVMDYTGVVGGVLLGAMIGRQGSEALPHDAYAVKWGYFDFASPPKYEGLAFCTDSDVYLYADCAKYDAGKNLVERKADNVAKGLRNIPRLLSEFYLASKANVNPRMRQPVEESTPSARLLAYSVYREWRGLLSLLNAELNLITLEQRYADLTDIDVERLNKDILEWQGEQVRNAGGIKDVFALIAPEAFDKEFASFPDRFRNVISDANYRGAALPEGGVVSFSATELGHMTRRAGELFPEVKEQLVAMINGALKNYLPALIDNAEAEEPLLANWFNYVLTSGEKGLDFQFSVATRKNALKSLFADGPYPDWLDGNVAGIAEALRAKLEEGFGMPIEEVEPDTFPRDERQRVMDEMEIYKKLVGFAGNVGDADGFAKK